MPSVYGPHRYLTPKGKPRWRIRVDGRSKSFADETAALEYAAAHRKNGPGRKKKAPAVSDGTWLGDLTTVRARIMARLESGELDELQAGRVLSQLATSAAKHVKFDAVEKRLEAVEEQQRVIVSARKHGARPAGPAGPSREAPRPGAPVH